MRSGFLGAMGRRVRALGLSEMRKKAIPSQGPEYRAVLRRGRETEHAATGRPRERDSVLQNHHGGRSR